MPVVRFPHFDRGNRWKARSPRLGRSMLVPAARIRMNQLTIERADGMRNKQEVDRAGQLSGNK